MLGGAAILARREMIEEVGGFDERFHMYAEDNEWCWRITKSDWRLMFVPEAVVLHHGAHSSKKRWTPSDQLRVKLRAGFEFEYRVLPRWRLAANQLANYMVVTVQIAGRKILGIQHPELQVIREMHREHFEALARELILTRNRSKLLSNGLHGRLGDTCTSLEQLLRANARTDQCKLLRPIVTAENADDFSVGVVNRTPRKTVAAVDLH